MLHILWLILKFILILLGIVLGLILLAVLLLLFCPMRYRASVSKRESGWKEIQGGGSISWLFHGIVLKAEWKDGNLQTAFYLFGIPITKLLKKRKGKTAANAGKTETKAEKTETIGKITETADNHNKKNTERNNIKTTDDQKDTEQERYEVKKKIADAEITTEAAMRQQQKNSEQTDGNEKIPVLKKVIASVQNKLRGIQRKLKGIRHTLQKIRNHVNWWKTFLEHPRVKAAVSLVWKHAKFLLKHIFPTRTEGKITFSSEDPAVSGMVLAVLGMTIPFHKNCIEILPLFNGENYLRGNISVRGRIYGFVFVRAAVVIYFDKNIKYVIKRWKTRRV